MEEDDEPMLPVRGCRWDCEVEMGSSKSLRSAIFNEEEGKEGIC